MMTARQPAAPASEKGRGPRVTTALTIAAVVVLALGLGGAGGLYRALQRQEDARVARGFQQAAETFFGRTLREVQLFMEVLDSIRQLHSLSDQVSPAAFEEIVRKGMIYQRRILGAYGFVQRIPHSMRAGYETPGGAGHPIVRADDRGNFVPMASRPEYFPLTYQTPPGGLGVQLGYDFGARPADAAAIAAAERLGVFALGGPVFGAAGSGEAYMFAPIMYSDAPQSLVTVGYAIGLFQPAHILATARGDLPPGLHARLEENRVPAAPVGGLHFSKEFSLANQEWRFVVTADSTYATAVRSRAPELSAALLAAAALLFAALLLRMAGRTRRIEALVSQRTVELAAANRALQAAMEDRRKLEDEVLRISGREKARIGSDLHDSLGQKLTGAMYLFGAYRQRVGAPDDAAAADAAQIAATLKDAVTQVRRIARGLAPVALTENGLPDALRHLAGESQALFQKNVEFFAEREGQPQNAGTAEHLYLIAQEAVNNAARHSGATRIVITLDYDERGGELTIEDNGRGLSAAAPADDLGGSGLRIMRHRAEVFGGELFIEPVPAGGLRVRCRFPHA